MPIVFYSDFWAVVLVMVTGGIVGGIVNYHFKPTATEDPPVLKPPYWIRCILVGIGAALIVPLFLYLTRSELLTDLKLGSQLSEKQTSSTATQSATAVASNRVASGAGVSTLPAITTVTTTSVSSGSVIPQRSAEVTTARGIMGSYLVFFSLCVLAAVSGFGFIPAMTGKLLALVKEAKEKADIAKKEATEAKSQLDTQKVLMREIIPAVNSNNARIAAARPAGRVGALVVPGGGLSAQDQAIADGLARPRRQPTDPQKGRWGGDVESANYRLQANIKAVDQQQEYFTVTLWVKAKDSVDHPLTGQVTFFLPDEITESQQAIRVDDGQASLMLLTWRSFTVGAVTDNGETLELDLATLSTAPQSFRQRNV